MRPRGRGVYAGAGIFLPAVGCGIGTSLSLAGSHGYYWASVPYSGNYNSWHLYFSSAYCGMDDYYRYYGQPVRPVLGAE